MLVTQVRNKSAPISFLDAGALPRPNDVFDGDLRGNWTLEVRLILLELSHQLPKSRDLALCQFFEIDLPDVNGPRGDTEEQYAILLYWALYLAVTTFIAALEQAYIAPLAMS